MYDPTEAANDPVLSPYCLNLLSWRYSAIFKMLSIQTDFARIPHNKIFNQTKMWLFILCCLLSGNSLCFIFSAEEIGLVVSPHV